MRQTLCLILLAVCCALSETHAQSITVIVTDIPNAKGKIWVALYNSKDDYMKKRLLSAGEAAKEGSVRLVLENVPKGEYAISILHDENLNSKMDTKRFGIPAEGFGFSNNATGNFGPPAWDKVKFNFEGKDQAMTIKLMHM